MSIVALDAVSTAKRKLQSRIRTDEAQRAFVFVMGVSDGATLESWLQDAGNLAAFEALAADGTLRASVDGSTSATDAINNSATATGVWTA